MSLGIDLRGLGWAFSFATVLISDFDRALQVVHLRIGRAVGEKRQHLVPENLRHMDTRMGQVPKELEAHGPTEGLPRVVFEFRGMLVFFKPPGWEVDDEDSRARGRRLSRYLQWRYPWSAVSRDPEHAFGIIHRLDLPSSGLILAGSTYEGHYAIKWQLDTAQIVREYIVLCHGWMPPSMCEVDAPVHFISTRSPALATLPPEKSARRSVVCEMGKPARTLIRVLAHAVRGESAYSLLAVRICTGRRHQIRAHLHHTGHPTVADGKYTRASVFAADLTWCPRNFLHRQRLQFRDEDGNTQEATEPMPDDLRSALRKLQPCNAASKEAIEEWISGHKPRPWDEYDILKCE